MQTYLSTVDGGKTISTYQEKQKLCRRGDPADSVLYIQEGKVKIRVMPELGKEAVVASHDKDDFFGERCFTGQPLRLATVMAMTECVIMRLDNAAVVNVLRDELQFSKAFISFLLARNARVEEDLVNQLFNSSEKRLASVLFLFGEFRQGETRDGHNEDQPREAYRNGRIDAIACERFFMNKFLVGCSASSLASQALTDKDRPKIRRRSVIREGVSAGRTTKG